MRSIFAFGVLIALCCSAEAATVHHAHTRHHRLTAFANSFLYEPARLPVHYDTPSYSDAPGYNDASKFGGSTALPAE